VIPPPRGARRIGAAVALVALLALAGCSSSADVASSSSSTAASAQGSDGLVAPEGFRTVTLVVTRPDGTTEELCLWLADTGALRAKGLMGVTDPDLGGADGMLFTFSDDTAGAFWMRSTPLPLSIAWYAGDGAFIATADMEPCPDDTADAACPRFGPASPYRYAVEAPSGALADLGLVEGSTVELGGACSLTA
jgi:uncharacterized membrane protein (UPF0127 family)